MYWRGRMAEDDRDYGVARAYYQKLSERYRNYYYGVLARKRLATHAGGSGGYCGGSAACFVRGGT